MEKRRDPRVPYRIRAFMGDSDEGRLFESMDVSASGAYFLNDPGVEPGTEVLMRLEYSMNRDGREFIYPLSAEVQVVRLSRGEGTVLGFGARWISVASKGDITPLMEFLRVTLTINTGFVEAIKPETGDSGTFYVFAFPKPGAAREGPAKAPSETAAPRAPTPAPDSPSLEEPRRTSTGLYVVLPVTFGTEMGEFEGTALKLMEHGCRISTSAALPEAYRRITVRVPVSSREKPSVINLTATVTTLRRPTSETGEGQFEVEFSLANDPKALAEYRELILRLQERAGEG